MDEVVSLVTTDRPDNPDVSLFDTGISTVCVTGSQAYGIGTGSCVGMDRILFG